MELKKSKCLSSRLRYTGIVEDLIDGKKTTESCCFFVREGSKQVGFRKYEDKVSGYTIKQIEEALRGQETWNGWKENIKKRYDNPSEIYLDEAFRFWNLK